LLDWILTYWLQVLFSGILGAVCLVGRYLWRSLKKDFIDVIKANQKEIKTLSESVDKRFDSIDTRIDELSQQSTSSDLALIKDSLLRKIRYGLSDDCVSLADLETCAALMAQYEKLGGNGEVHKLYKRYEKLHVCSEHDFHIDFEEE